MADSESTRPIRRDRIVDECNVLRQGLQDLLNAYINNNRNNNQFSDQIERATIEMTKMTKNLRRQLRKAVIDHISDSFLETNLPLETMIEVALIVQWKMKAPEKKPLVITAKPQDV